MEEEQEHEEKGKGKKGTKKQQEQERKARSDVGKLSPLRDPWRFWRGCWVCDCIPMVGRAAFICILNSPASSNSGGEGSHGRSSWHTDYKPKQNTACSRDSPILDCVLAVGGVLAVRLVTRGLGCSRRKHRLGSHRDPCPGVNPSRPGRATFQKSASLTGQQD